MSETLQKNIILRLGLTFNMLDLLSIFRTDRDCRFPFAGVITYASMSALLYFPPNRINWSDFDRFITKKVIEPFLY